MLSEGTSVTPVILSPTAVLTSVTVSVLMSTSSPVRGAGGGQPNVVANRASAKTLEMILCVMALVENGKEEWLVGMLAIAVETVASISKALLTLNPKVNKLIEFCTHTRPIFLQGSNRTCYR